MEYKIYKLKFKNAVHFENGSLDRSDYRFGADTLFSALCIEALKYGEDTLKELIQIVRSDYVCFSDAFPYINNTFYLPKPALKSPDNKSKSDFEQERRCQTLPYISCEAFEDYLRGQFDEKDVPDISKLGSYDMRVSASIRGEEKPGPYTISSFLFYDECGLYIIIGYKDIDQLYLIEDLLMSLSYSGIGGKRMSGYGRFSLFPAKIPAELEERLGRNSSWKMILSGALPREDELEAALAEARYHLIKRSGYVGSHHYSKATMRKKDLYLFESGSCFRVSFHGDIYDVSAGKGSHPVYRYAKPLFLGVDI